MEFDVQSWMQSAAFLGGAFAMGFGAIGAAIGEGYTAGQATTAILRNREISKVIFKNMLVGQALSESASIFSLVIAIMLLFSDVSTASLVKAAAFAGAGLSMGFGAMGSGVGSGLPAGQCCLGIARQPAISGRITTNMLIGTAVCQTPAIFAMVVSLILIFLDYGNAPLFPTSAALIGAGLSIGLSAVGSGYGGGVSAGASCEAIARQPQSVGNVTTVMLIGQAVSQTPSIFGLLVSFILMFKPNPEPNVFTGSIALLSAGMCMGFGGIGSGIGNGLVAGGAIRGIAASIKHAGELTRVMLVGQAVSQSPAVGAMIVSLILIFVV